MKTSTLLTALSAFGTVSALALPDNIVENVAPGIGIIERAADNFPGLSALQSQRAQAIIDETKNEGLGRQGCEAAITTGLTESSLRILANRAVPASLNFKNDGLGSDHDSIGIFQQRAMFYKNISCDMNAACSASQFFKDMKAVSGWRTMDVATLCQRVQRSAFPDAYRKYVGVAANICKAGGL